MCRSTHLIEPYRSPAAVPIAALGPSDKAGHWGPSQTAERG